MMAWNTDDEAGGSEGDATCLETPQIIWVPMKFKEHSTNTRPKLDYSYARLSGTALRTGQQPNM